MRYISLFSGIEAASVAWRDLGWEPVAFSEIEPYPCEVLRQRFPHVPNLGDITAIDWQKVVDEHGAIDLIVGGSPCQSFSYAGKREGLQGESRLMFEYLRAVEEVRPRWIVWENVPGALTSDGGQAFGQLLQTLADLGYGLAWRVLDAQHFGVAQRRRRIFLVGHLGDERASEVLFEPGSLRRDYASSKEKREELAAALGRSTHGVHDEPKTLKLRHTGSPLVGGGSGPLVQENLSATLGTSNDQTLIHKTGMDVLPLNFNPTDSRLKIEPQDISQTLTSRAGTGGNQTPLVAFSKTHRSATADDATTWSESEVANTLNVFDVGDTRCNEIVCVNSTMSDVCGTLCAADGPQGVTGQSWREGKVIFQRMDDESIGGGSTPWVIDRAAFNQGQNALYRPHIEQTEVMDSLVARGPHAVCIQEIEDEMYKPHEFFVLKG